MWIEKLPNGKYKFCERYKDPYTEKYKRVSVTLTSKSNQAKKQAMQELHEKINKKNTAPKQKAIAFGTAVSLFVPNYKKKVKSSSFIAYKSTEKAILKTIGEDTIIKNIDLKFLKGKIENLYYNEKYSFNYVKKIKAFILMILEYAKDLGYETDVPKYKLNLNLRQKTKREKYLEKDELSALLTQLRKNKLNERKADMVEFMALTGLRYGELIALREEDLFEEYIKVNGTIDFRNGIYSEVIRTTPKTSAAFRKIGLTENAINILIKVLQENYVLKTTPEYDDQGYIFTNKKGLPIDYRTFEPVLKKQAEKAGIKKPVTTHYLRHTHISFLAELNVPLKAVMERVGHTDASTTLQIYTHVTNKMHNDLLDKLETISY